MLRKLFRVFKKPGLTVSSLPAALIISALFSCSPPKKQPWEMAPLEESLDWTRLKDASGLRVDRFRFHSQTLDEPRFFLVLYPQTGELPDRVLIVNHGWFDRPEYLLSRLRLDQAYAKLLSTGSVKPALLVIPDVRFDNNLRKNAASFPFAQYLPLIVEETLPRMSQHYGLRIARKNCGIAGFSFGGYVSLDIGRRYPGQFESVTAISAFYDEQWLFWARETPETGPTDASGRGKQTIVVPGPIPRLFLACGTRDRFFKIMTRLHSKFEKAGIGHAWSSSPGGHTWEYWQSVLEDMLKFHLGS